ncbi:MAG: transcription termination/antitermination NusG family protein [Methylocella sp.]
MDWYVAYTKAQAEERAAEGIARHGFEPYLPILTEQVRRRWKQLAIARPLFPRYIFLGFAAAPPWLKVTVIEG